MKDKMKKWVEKARTAIKWIAVDVNGMVYGYTKKPTFNKKDGNWYMHYKSRHHDMICLGKLNNTKMDYTKSLRKVNYEKR